MRRCLQIIALILFITMSADASAPIDPIVKKCVVFIFANLPGNRIAAGTGFFIGVRSPSSPERSYMYLVTARHVLQLPDQSMYFSEVFLRLNRRDSTAEVINVPIVLDGANQTVFLPEDTTVDLAVLPVRPNEKIYEFRFLTEEMITTKESINQLSIGEGSDVFFTGLFLSHIGSIQNQPIVRFGRVALLTPERVQWQRSNIFLYLMETASFGGNSGSPVFFYLGSDRQPGSLTVGSPEIYLAGVMKGTFNEEHPINTGSTPTSIESQGIAGVIPAFQLKELLFGKELSRLRK